ncbi:SsrA-binding protein SmpB [Helicobacter mustelae]|uniref:SsrA-binding protein n=1 Tax=Helicobacter mustelae (strain ATCC 43772 / CCUG 25715 / CIP 103759 / LMG 18044 / NCTC 12198 / R85-136P) TaxID=679897 RepID=D3UI86_HELM1|nr:SsrA-binding protein SmpB [Helicobacter mustelae]CBG40209.1 SsrA-binding protein [Helicobacter mustelae 12198]SQH71709.1 SsrA-binding protein [Helicobacter mustelae]
MHIIARNKKAFFDYEILESLEAGIVLLGSEVKALRKGRVNLKDSFVKVVKGEMFMFGAHISYLETTYLYYKPNETRPRKLLLHRRQIDRLFGAVSQQGLSIVPLKIYFNARNHAKLEIALVRGKNLHDKRESIKRKMLEKEARANMKNYTKGL